MSAAYLERDEGRLKSWYNETKQYKLAIGFSDLAFVQENFRDAGLFVNILNKLYGAGIQHWVLVFVEQLKNDEEAIAFGIELDVENGQIVSKIPFNFQTRYGLYYLYNSEWQTINPYEFYMENVKNHAMIGQQYTAREHNCQRFIKSLFPAIEFDTLASTATNWYAWTIAAKFDTAARQGIFRLDSL